MQMNEAVDEYLLACRVNNISKKTMASYVYNINNFIDVIGNKSVFDLSPNDVRAFMVHEMDRKNDKTGELLSSETRMKSYGVIRTFCRWLYNQELTPSCVTDKTQAPRTDHLMPEALTREEVQKIFQHIEYCRSFRDKVIWEFFLDTGCRVAEVAGLKLNDINFNEGWAKVFGKGRREGMVPMGSKLCDDLHKYIHRYRRAPADEMHVFVSLRDPHRQLTKEGLSSLIKRVHKTVGINGKYGPHKLRHTMATQFIANGGDVAILRRILRHSDIKTTQRYINLVQSDVQSSHRNYSPLDHLDY